MTMTNDLLFDRRWRVTVGPAGQPGRSWEGLRVGFKVEKNGDASPNKLDLAIYNLSADSRAFIQKKMAVRLEAGYAGAGPKLLFTGAIELADHEHEGPDWTTRITSADGVRAYRSTVLAESFGPKTTEAAVVRKVADAMGVTVGELKGLSQEKFNQGRTLTGPARAALDALCRSRGLRWSIQDGILQIIPVGEALSQSAVLLNPATGLVGSPKRTEKGIEVVSLLQGGINPGRLVQVESEAVKGLFVVENVIHKGDSDGRDWYSTLEAIKAS